MTTIDAPAHRRVSRWLSPAGLILAGILLFMPFVAVSCDAPGGFGHAAPGGTTTYTGVTLATGGAPDVTRDKVRAAAEQRDDTLGPQPLAIAVVVLILGGLVTAITIESRRRRRITVMIVATVAAVFLAANQVTVRALLESRLREQLTVAMPAGKDASDYVQDQSGFWACLATLLLVAIVNGVGWFRTRRTDVTT